MQQRLIYRARQLNTGKEEEAEEEVRKSVAEWKKNRETILRSDTLIVFGRGGISDAPYQFLAASVLAKQYPEKKVLSVSHLVTSPLLTPQSQNMYVVPRLHNATEHLVHAKETAVFSLSFANEISNEETEKTVQYLHSLRRQDGSPARAKIEANASQTVLDRMR